MDAPAGSLPRTARAGVFALAAVVLAAAAHATGHGVAPSWPVAGIAAAAVFAAARAAAGRERSFAGIAAAMVAVQAGLHAGFMLVPPMPAADSPAGAMARVLCGHRLASAPAAFPPVAGMPGMAGMGGAAHAHPAGFDLAGGPDGWGMLAAHLAAALLLAWWLRSGEAAVWALARSSRRVVLHLLVILWPVLGPTSLTRARQWARHQTRVRRLRCQLLRHTLVLRGPPPALASC
jgi:hypothetical protein